MFDKDRLLDVLENAHQQEIVFADSLSDEQRAASGQPDAWSAKDIIAHLAAWRTRLLDTLQAGLRGERRPEDGDADMDHTNLGIFEEHRGKTWEEVTAMLDEAHYRALDFVRLTPEADLLDPEKAPNANRRPPWQALLAENVSHATAHLWQFQLEHGEPDQAIALQESIAQSLQGFADPTVASYGVYNLACVYARTGRHENAIRTLGESLRLNPSLTEWSKQDPDLNALRDEPAYLALYA